MAIKLARNRLNTDHSAQNNLEGFVSNGSDWSETLTIVDEDGDQVTGVGSDEWRMQFRPAELDTAATLTLTTTDSTLTITVGTTTTLAIACPQASLTNLIGDYIVDIVSKAASDDALTHRAHGVVTFRNAPLAF